MHNISQEQMDYPFSNTNFPYCDGVESNINILSEHFIDGTDTALIKLNDQRCLNNLDIFNTRANNIILYFTSGAYQFYNQIQITGKTAEITILGDMSGIFDHVETVNVSKLNIVTEDKVQTENTLNNLGKITINGLTTDLLSINGKEVLLSGKVVSKEINIKLSGQNQNKHGLKVDEEATLSSTSLKVDDKTVDGYGVLLNGKAIITGLTDILSNKNISLSGDLQSHEGNIKSEGLISIKGQLATKGKINIDGSSVEIYETSTILSTQNDVVIKALKEGTLHINGKVQGNKIDVESEVLILNDKGLLITINGDQVSASGINIIGSRVINIKPSAKVTCASNVTIQGGNEAFEIKGEVLAEDDVNVSDYISYVQTHVGQKLINGKIVSKNGQIDITSAADIHITDGVILGKKDIVIESLENSIILTPEYDRRYLPLSEKEQTLSSEEGEIKLKAYEDIKVKYSKLRALNNITFEAESNKEIELFRSEIISQGKLHIVNRGSVEIKESYILAKQDIEIESKESSVGLMGKLDCYTLLIAQENQIFDQGNEFNEADEFSFNGRYVFSRSCHITAGQNGITNKSGVFSSKEVDERNYLIISEEGSVVLKAFSSISQQNGKIQAKKDIVQNNTHEKLGPKIQFLEKSQAVSVDGKIIIQTPFDIEIEGRLEGSIDLKAQQIRVSDRGSIITNNKDIKIDLESCNEQKECLKGLPLNTLGSLEIAVKNYKPGNYIINEPQIVGGQYKLRLGKEHQANIYVNEDAYVKAGSIVITSYDGRKVWSVNINGGQIEASDDYATNSVRAQYFKLSPKTYKKWYEFNNQIRSLNQWFNPGCGSDMAQRYQNHLDSKVGTIKPGDFDFASKVAVYGTAWGMMGTIQSYVTSLINQYGPSGSISGTGCYDKYYRVLCNAWQDCEYDGKYSISDPAKLIISGYFNIDAKEIENRLSFIVVYKTLNFMGKPNINIFSDSILRWEWSQHLEPRHAAVNYDRYLIHCISKPISTVSSVIHAGKLTGDASNIKIGTITTGNNIPQIGTGNSNAVERANDINNALNGHKIQAPIAPFGDMANDNLTPEQMNQALYYKKLRDNYFKSSGYDIRYSTSGVTLNPSIWQVDTSLDNLLNSNDNDDLTIHPMVRLNNHIARDIDSTYIIKQMLTDLDYKGKGILPTLGDIFYIQSLVQTAILQHIGLMEGLDYANIIQQLISNTYAEYKRLGIDGVAFPPSQILNLEKPILAPLIIEKCIGDLSCLSFELFVNAQSVNTIKQDRALSADSTIDLDVSGKVIIDAMNTISAGSNLKVSAGDGVLMLGRAEAPVQEWNTTVFINAGEVVTAQSLVVSAVNMLITGKIAGEGNVTLKAVENIVLTAMIKTLQGAGWSSSYFYTRVESQADINIGGTLRLEAGNDIYNVASRMVGNKVELIANGNTYIVSLDIYNQLSVWGKKYFYSYRELKQLQPVIQAIGDNVYIESAQETLLRAPIITASGDGVFISGKFKQISADEYVEVIVMNKKSSGLFGSERTTTKEHNSTPALAYFFIGKTLGVKTDGDQIWQSPQVIAHDVKLIAGTPSHAAHITFINSYHTNTIEVHTQKSGFSIGFNNGGMECTFKKESKNIDGSAQVQPTIFRLEGDFYGYASGNWVMLSSSIDAKGKITIDATNIDLGVAPDFKYKYAFMSKTGFGVGFSDREGEFAIKAGVFQRRESHTRAETTHTQTSFNANYIEFNAIETLKYSGIIINAVTFKEHAKIIIKGVLKDTVEEKHFKSEMEAGVKLGVKSNWGSIMQGSKKLKSLDPNHAEDIVTGYFTAVELITNIAQLVSGAGISYGVWAYFEYTKDSSHSTVINAVPVIINACDAETIAQEVNMVGTQMRAYDYYLKTTRLNISPAQNTVQYESETQVFDVNIPIWGPNTAGLSATMGTGKGEQVNNLNTHILVNGRLEMIVEGHADIRGAYISAASIEMNFNSLLLESVADILSDESIRAGFNVGSGSTGKIGLESLGAHGEFSKHKRNMIGQMTAIVGVESVNIVVANTLRLIGALVANAERNEDGTYTDHGNMTLKVGELFVYHIKEHDDGVTLGAAANILSDYQDKFKFAGHKVKGETRATMGKGNVTTSSGNVDDANRDINNAQKLDEKYRVRPIEVESSMTRPLERMNKALEPFEGKDLSDIAKDTVDKIAQAAEEASKEFWSMFDRLFDYVHGDSNGGRHKDIETGQAEPQKDDEVEQQNEENKENKEKEDDSHNNDEAEDERDIKDKSKDKEKNKKDKQTKKPKSDKEDAESVDGNIKDDPHIPTEIFTDAYTAGCNKIDNGLGSKTDKEEAKKLLYAAMNEINNLDFSAKQDLFGQVEEKVKNLNQGCTTEDVLKMASLPVTVPLSVIKAFFGASQAQAATPGIPVMVYACVNNPACVGSIIAIAATTTYYAKEASGKTWQYVSQAFRSEENGQDGDVLERTRKEEEARRKENSRANIKQGGGSAAAGGMPPDDFDPDDPRNNKKWKEWSKNSEGKWHHPEAKDFEGIPNKPNAQHPKLQNVYNEVYRSTDKIPGGSAQALREEVRAGHVNPRHIDKVQERISNINNLFKLRGEEALSELDRQSALRVRNDLQKALDFAMKGIKK